MKKWMVVGAMALAVVAADATLARAQDSFVDENGDGVDDGVARMHRHGRRGMLQGVRSQLTDDQLAEVRAALESLKAADASREDIQAAFATLLEGYGVDLPEPGDRMAERLASVLTEEQLAEVQSRVDELKAAEASRADIHAAVGTLLEGYGVEAPIPQGRPGSVLSEAQLTSLRTEIDALRSSGASHEDIRAAFEAKLGEFGVDPASVRGGKGGGRGGSGKFRGRRGGFRGPAPAPAEDAAAADAN